MAQERLKSIFASPEADGRGLDRHCRGDERGNAEAGGVVPCLAGCVARLIEFAAHGVQAGQVDRGSGGQIEGAGRERGVTGALEAGAVCGRQHLYCAELVEDPQLPVREPAGPGDGQRAAQHGPGVGEAATTSAAGDDVECFTDQFGPPDPFGVGSRLVGQVLGFDALLAAAQLERQPGPEHEYPGIDPMAGGGHGERRHVLPGLGHTPGRQAALGEQLVDSVRGVWPVL